MPIHGTHPRGAPHAAALPLMAEKAPQCFSEHPQAHHRHHYLAQSFSLLALQAKALLASSSFHSLCRACSASGTGSHLGATTTPGGASPAQRCCASLRMSLPAVLRGGSRRGSAQAASPPCSSASASRHPKAPGELSSFLASPKWLCFCQAATSGMGALGCFAAELQQRLGGSSLLGCLGPAAFAALAGKGGSAALAEARQPFSPLLSKRECQVNQAAHIAIAFKPHA